MRADSSPMSSPKIWGAAWISTPMLRPMMWTWCLYTSSQLVIAASPPPMLRPPALEASFDPTSEQFTVRPTDRRQPRELHHARQRIIRAADTEGDPANTGRAPHGHNSTAVWLPHHVHFVSDGVVA